MSQACDLLSNELLDEYGDAADLVIVGNKSKSCSKSNKTKVEKKSTLTKSEQRKLRLLQVKKEKAARRRDLFASLSASSLKVEEQNLMQSSGRLGQEDTLKQRLKRVIAEEQLGVEVTDRDKLILGRKRKEWEEVPEFAEEVLAPNESVVFTKPDCEVMVLDDDQNGERKKKKRRRKVIVENKSDGVEVNQTESVEDQPVNEHYADIDVDEVNRKAKLIQENTFTAASTAQVDILLSKLSGSKSNHQKSQKFFVSVTRDDKIQNQRRQLPIFGEEQLLIETINENPFVVVCGATGSGKTTQLPQFLLENGYGFSEAGLPGMIGVTQPRRVAAVSTARRVKEELGSHGNLVGYHIRYDCKANDEETKIKFMTDGILLKEIQSDFLLKKYSVILVDEAHERNLNTDVLIGLLSRIVPLRKKKELPPLKVVIMSATLRVSDFTENRSLFPLSVPPVVEIGARQFPVTIHFNRVTPISDYLDAAFKKIIKIHSKLPPGGILVFLTGKQEIDFLCRKLKTALNQKKTNFSNLKKSEETNGEISGEISDSDNENEEEVEKDVENLKATRELSEETAIDGISENIDDSEWLLESALSAVVEKVRVLPLYGLLSTELQMQVFDDSVDPNEERLIVIATNVAETSITIPGIKYVVDCGREKSRVYDRVTGVSTFVVDWISKASADQRSGRAGRVGPGHCYRLYSSAVYQYRFPQFSAPEIQIIPIDSMVMQLKAMGVQNIEEFPFPTPPDSEALKSSVNLLKHLGALDVKSEEITVLGRLLSLFPLSPRYGKMLALADQGNCLKYTIAIVAAMSVGNIWLSDAMDQIMDENDDIDDGKTDKEEEHMDKSRKKSQTQRAFNSSRQFWSHRKSDLLSEMNLVCASDYVEDLDKFCAEYFLRKKSLVEIRKLRLQLVSLIDQVLGRKNRTTIYSNGAEEDRFGDDIEEEEDISYRKKSKESLQIQPPTEEQEILLCQIIAFGFIDQVARKMSSESVDKTKRVFDDTSVSGGAYECLASNLPVFVHPHSHLFDKQYQPDLLVYQELVHGRKCKSYMRGITAISLNMLANLAKESPSLCVLSKPLDSPPPFYDPASDQIMCFVRGSFGSCGWRLPIVKVPFPLDSVERYQIFMKLLMEGLIFEELKDFHPCWTCRPASIVSISLARQSIQVARVVELFAKLKIDSKPTFKKSLSGENNKRLFATLVDYLTTLIRPFFQDEFRQVLSKLLA